MFTRRIPPPRSKFKLDFDSSITRTLATSDLLTRDDNESLCQAITFNIGSCPVFMEEAFALIKVLKSFRYGNM